ncbi:hypothetical protein REJC140_00087 [Pseudorhizobium endolithicum]|uniref:Uncharacterized protein n=1 Tax=Pseudorhizobium endolithicum TaxID=1191678 RepID=A0ABM8PCE3_9HYPH|nr:hypothetical protein [Pseudorhizobium endolithicum]CAD7023082.1 hypothetical protein REJC140_00087 [Pseudorhizobium endolithicum]
MVMKIKPRKYVAVQESGGGRSVFFPFGIYGSQTNAEPAQVSSWVSMHSEDPTNLGANSDRSIRFAVLQQAIKHMALLPDDHTLHVDAEAAERASSILAVISQNFSVKPPKVMPQDGEGVVFTWDYGDLKRYLTVEEDDLDVMDLNKRLGVKCVHDVAHDMTVFEKLVELIGAPPASSTTMDADA